MRKVICFLTLLIACCCKGKKEEAVVKPVVETIHVDISSKAGTIPFEDVFDSMRLVPLETTPESLLGIIGRIIIHKNDIYILNKQAQSILVFDGNGKFLRKIHKVGGGEGEYYQLMDFAIDNDKERLILLTDRPEALYYYDLEGTFITRESLPTYYINILYADGKLLLVNQKSDLEYKVFVRDMETGEVAQYLGITENDRIFENFGIGSSYSGFYPRAIKSNSPHIFFPYTDTIYQLMDGTVSPKYKIDFGKQSIPKGFFNDERSASDNYQLAMDGGYGSFIANFKESKDFVCFSFGGGNCTMVVYSKKT